MAGSYDGDFQFVSKVGKNDGGNVEIEKTLTVGGNVIADGDGINQDLIPPASDEIAGKVKIGNGIAVDSNGEISLTPATEQQLGGITPGEGLATDQDGKLDFTGVFGGILYVLEDDQETGGGIVAQNSVTVAGNLIADGNGLNLELIPLATDEVAGKVKIGNGISVLSDGTIYLTVEPVAASDFAAHLANPDAHGAGSTPSAGKIAQWNEDGNLESGEPTKDSEVATRAFIAEIVRTTVINVKARTGAVVRIQIGNTVETLNADEDGFVNLETKHQGDCVISATYRGIPVGNVETFIVYQYNKYEINLQIPEGFILYGVRHYVNESSPALTRLGDSANFTFTPETPTQIGESDFDDGPIYSEIKTCDVDFVGGEMEIVYDDDPGFTRTPESGDVCVEIPKFFYWRDGSHLNDSTPYEDIYISDVKVNNNFLTSPAHMDRGDGVGERDKVWVGAYVSTTGWRSISGKARVTETLPNSRTSYKSRGSRYYMEDYATHATIILLYLVEVANLDSRAGVGSGQTVVNISGGTDEMIYCSGVPESFQIYRTSGYVPADYDSATAYEEGDLVSYNEGFWRAIDATTGNAPEEGEYWTNIEEDYDPEKTYQIGDRCVYNRYLWLCTGETTGTFNTSKWSSVSNQKSVKYRGLENLWGIPNQMVDGVLSYSHDLYLAINPDEYGESTGSEYYKKVGYRFADSGYIKKIGYDPEIPFAFFATDVGASSTTYFTDYTYNGGNNVNISVWGSAGYANGEGIFCNQSHLKVSNSKYPSRLLIM